MKMILLFILHKFKIYFLIMMVKWNWKWCNNQQFTKLDHAFDAFCYQPNIHTDELSYNVSESFTPNICLKIWFNMLCEINYVKTAINNFFI